MSIEPEDDVVAAIQELKSRNYAEIGVPMILIAEDLTKDPAEQDGVSSPENEKLAESFSRVWQAMNAHNSNLTAWDVSHAIELLADRHMHSLLAIGTSKPVVKD